MATLRFSPEDLWDDGMMVPFVNRVEDINNWGFRNRYLKYLHCPVTELGEISSSLPIQLYGGSMRPHFQRNTMYICKLI